MGFPILVKAVMGGGGKGMKLAMSAADLRVSPTPIQNTHLCVELLQNLSGRESGLGPCHESKLHCPFQDFVRVLLQSTETPGCV